MVVKWSAVSPSIPTIRVLIPLKPTVCLYNLCLKRSKINKKRPGLVPFFKKSFSNEQMQLDFFSFREKARHLDEGDQSL